MQVKFVIRNLEAVKSYLKALPRGVTKVALEAMAEYLVGDKSHGLRHADPYKYVTRASAYGFSFFTDKQRRWFFAALNSGELKIGNNRTGESTDAWTYKETNNGYGYTLVNPTQGAYFTQSDKGQARQPAKVGWRTVTQNIADNYLGAIRHASAMVKAYLQSNK